MPFLHDHHVCALHSHRSDFTLPGAEAHYPPHLELEPSHLDIELRLDLERARASGTVTTTVEARRAGPRSIELHAVDFQDVRVADPEGRALEFTYDGRILKVTWEHPFAAGESRRLAVSYAVEKPATGLFFSKPSDAYPKQAWYAGTDHETERARHWLPCIDLPSARPRLDLRLRAESRFTILANGALVGETDHGDGSKTAHWRLEERCPSYLTCFAAGDLVRAEDGDFEGRPVAYFATREFTPEHLRRSFGRTREMLAWITRKLGSPFPYPKYYQCALPGFGGAMEDISLVMWDDMFVLDETLAREWTWLVDQINIHEMAHSYFGDWIVCRDFAHAWLKESWATYIETCWLEDKKGRDEGDYDFFVNAHQYFGEADGRYKRPIVTRVFNHSWHLYDRHLYPGGACRLHTLRKHLGDETFWAAVRDYVASYGGHTVETDDFRRVMEKHSGRSLGKFFDQWFHSKGYPSLKVSFGWDAEKREGSFEIEQAQVDEKEGVPAFEFDLVLAWRIDGTWHRRTVEVNARKHTVLAPMAADPEQVRVDPDGRVLHKLDFHPGDARLKRQLTEAEDVVGRILAARALAKSARPKNLEAIRDAYRKETFWGVRKEWAAALAKARTGVAVEALATCLEWEKDPMVLEGLIRAAGSFRDERARAALEKRVEAGDLPYRALAAAYEMLGMQRDDAPLERLLRAARAKGDGFGWHAQSGAYRGLAATRTREAARALLERSRYGGSPARSRPACVAALGDAGRPLEKADRDRVLERLVDLLRDPVDRVRRAAMAGLESLCASEAIGALRAYRETLSEQEAADVDRAIRALRDEEKPKVAALEKRLEELDERLRKLGGSVQKIEAREEKDGKARGKGGAFARRGAGAKAAGKGSGRSRGKRGKAKGKRAR